MGWTGGAEATAKADMEHWNERDNRVWKKIQKWLDIFDKDPDFGDTVNKAYLPQFLGGKSIIGYISSQKGLITDEKQRYFVAAAYLANINKGGGPYARMAHLQFTGHWVKLLLGKEHHERFVRQYKLQKAEFDDEK
ncbi:MAG: hypothetical protein LBP53_04985 [Candidatus Peribacteria bacterium]|nr:hypothetical protein [Candidatus Peribacteria bacterium]